MSGLQILEQLLALEASSKRNFFFFAIIPVAYYCLHFLVIDTNYELRLAIALDAVSVFTYYSLPWLQPLHIALGRDVVGLSEENTPANPLNFVNVFQDSTLRITGITNLIAFALMLGGDITFFVSLGWFNEIAKQENGGSPPLPLAALYVLGSITSNFALALGNAYIALTHNIIAARLQALAHQLEHGLFQHDEAAADYGAVEMGDHSDTGNNPTLLQSDNYPLTAAWVAQQHAEFRRQQDTLAASFHRRVLLATFAFSIELVLQVKAGFEEQRKDFSNIELAGLIVMFFGNAYSVWTTAFTMGRVPFVSREETAFAAQKRALLKPDPELVPVAHAMTLFPITFHVGPFEWSSEISKAYTLFILSLAGIFVGVQLPEFD